MQTQVMLASPARRPALEEIARLEAAGGWWFEFKWDGIRAVVHRTRAGVVRITNRNEYDITTRYPDVVAAWGGVDFVGSVDGEIIAVDGRGRPDFALIHKRDAQSTPAKIRALAVSIPATFVPFDVLEDNGFDQRAQPYTVRRERLEALFGAEGSVWSQSTQEGMLMWQVVQEWHLEGLVAKRGAGRYHSGRRHPSWVKLKAVKRVHALVGGVVPGKGSRGPVGALEIYLYDPDAHRLVPIGRVGSGIRDADAVIITQRLAAGEPVVVEVEYLEVAATGQLRMPVFKHLVDVAPDSCTIDTLKP